MSARALAAKSPNGTGEPQGVNGVMLPWPHIMAEARRLFIYDSETGLFTRRVRSGQKGRVGDVAGARDPQGYIRLRVFGGKQAAHRIAWSWVNGDAEPPLMIDHINGVRDDNRAENIRPANPKLNAENQRRARADNKLGVLGVRVRSNGRYEARIWVDGRPRQLGTFDSKGEAQAAYCAAKRVYHAGCTL